MRTTPVIVVTIAVLALAFPLAAQQGPPVEHARGVIIDFLELTPEQVDTWDQLAAAHRAAAEDLRREIAAVERELEALLDDAEPDVSAIGALVVERRALGEQMGDLHNSYVGGFAAMLDAEQARRFEFIRRADRAQRILPAFRFLRLLPPR